MLIVLAVGLLLVVALRLLIWFAIAAGWMLYAVGRVMVWTVTGLWLTGRAAVRGIRHPSNNDGF